MEKETTTQNKEERKKINAKPLPRTTPQRESPQRSEELHSKSGAAIIRNEKTEQHSHESHEHHEGHEHPHNHTHEHAHDHTQTHSHEEKTENKEQKSDEKKEKKKEKVKVEKIKKEEAVAQGVSLPISKKHSMYICAFIKNKPIDQAIAELEEVEKMKRAIPFKGEIPHRKNLRGGSGRYPLNASYYFIKLLKGLKGNVLNNNMELENTRITLASATWASRPMKPKSRKAKRTNILLKAKEVVK